jgi:hypothetical protein
LNGVKLIPDEFLLYLQFLPVVVMKKIWLIFALVVIIVAQLTFMSSIYSTFTHSYVSGTSAVVVSKMKYAYARTSIHILRSPFSSTVTVTFPNGTQQEITESSYTMKLFLPRTGDFMGNYVTGTILTTTPNSPTDSPDSLPQISLSSKHPVDVDVVQNIPSNFLSWYGDPNYDFYNKIDVFWFTIQGEANILITGSGMAI